MNSPGRFVSVPGLPFVFEDSPLPVGWSVDQPARKYKRAGVTISLQILVGDFATRSKQVDPKMGYPFSGPPLLHFPLSLFFVNSSGKPGRGPQHVECRCCCQ